jgi:nitrogen-specific signal transduction histidine kinase/ActR/RegA family two-component response regulator
LWRLEKVRKDLLERERSARANAEESNRLKDQFLATVSHELRTPLNAILGWADMLRLPAIDSGTRDRASKSIYDNARQQARMIDELLDVARIVSGKLLLERTEVDLERIVRASIEIVEAAAEARHVAIEVDADESNDVVYGDASRLQQIVWNLLSNAVKFSEQGGRVVVRLRRAKSNAELTVSDDGIGIPTEFLPSVFEPFRQADASNTRRYGGLGLGLSIVKHLTEAHGGTITASSDGPTRGATFIVRLPTRPSVDRGTSVGRSAARSDVTESLSGLSVLVLDDDRESLAVASAHLKSRLAAVWLAESSQQAVEILQREDIDVILADIAMPGEDGYTFIKRVRALKVKASTTPAAALTALVREEDRQRALHSGFQLHLPKPIDRDSLIGVVARLARLSRLSTSGNLPS